jgi:hypothetical protein
MGADFIDALSRGAGNGKARTCRTLCRGTAKRLLENAPSRANWRVLGRGLQFENSRFSAKTVAELRKMIFSFRFLTFDLNASERTVRVLRRSMEMNKKEITPDPANVLQVRHRPALACSSCLL